MAWLHCSRDAAENNVPHVAANGLSYGHWQPQREHGSWPDHGRTATDVTASCITSLKQTRDGNAARLHGLA